MKYLAPHSEEWFHALAETNPARARAAFRIIRSVGQTDVCSNCGNSRASDYAIVGENFTDGIGATTRLCDSCREIARTTSRRRLRKLR